MLINMAMSQYFRTLNGIALCKSEILAIATCFSKYIKRGDLLLMEGKVGVGKTFFSREIINSKFITDGLKTEEVPSPTFSLIQKYQLKYFSILHLDLYRLDDETDLLELGIPDIFDENAVIVEWPDLLENFLPPRFILVSISFNKNCAELRDLKLEFFGENWEKLYSGLNNEFNNK